MTAMPPRLGNAELASTWQLPCVMHLGQRYGLLASLSPDRARIRLGLMSLSGPTRLVTITTDAEWPAVPGAIVLRNGELHAALREAGIATAMCIPCPGLGTAVLSTLTPRGLEELQRQMAFAEAA